MASPAEELRKLSAQLREGKSLEELGQLLTPDLGPSAFKVPSGQGMDEESRQARWDAAGAGEQAALFAPGVDAEAYGANIEHFLGCMQLPLGIAGPLRMRGLAAQGDIALPLATTEAALVASVHRGARLITKAGGCSALIQAEGVTRSPGFAFGNLRETGLFQSWVLEQEAQFAQLAAGTTRHGKLESMRLLAEGSTVYVLLDYSTGDAAGQNMVTLATQAVFDWILEHSPVKARHAFVEANASGDKKATAQSFMGVRGRKVTAEVWIPARLLQRALHVPVEKMIAYWEMSAMGGVLTGTLGVQGHYANTLAALFLATGQDVACVAEAAVGVTHFEALDDGLHATVTLPNLIVGSVGGGTGLPHAKACLELMGLAGTGKARALAELCAGAALAGELSIIGALAAGEFSQAHERLARKR